MTVKAPPLSERDFMAQVMQLATIYHWEALHLRPGMTRDSWRTPISGSLGKGWPDLLLLRESDGQRLAVELKRDGAKASPDQLRVLSVLDACGIPAYVFSPADWAAIEAVLR